MLNFFTRKILKFTFPGVPRLSSQCDRFYSTEKTPSATTLYLFQESDLEEQFVRGWGPGGQSVNRTANCVVLRHRPTGLSVKCQDTRVLAQNRNIARSRLNQKLDELWNGEASAVVQSRRDVEARERQRYSRAKRRLADKLAFKSREGLDSKDKETP